MKKALLIVDVQQFFTNEYTYGTAKNIVSYMQHHSYDDILFTVFKNHKQSSFALQLDRHKCKMGEDLKLDDVFAPYIRENNVFTKGTYSVFKNKAFRDYIGSKEEISFDICGTDTNACVLASAFDGFDLGYRINVLGDLCASHSGNIFHDAAIQILDKAMHVSAK
jgi:nicotinamidase-related amidase